MRLTANTEYWDTARGPHLQEVVFRNDLSPERALELVATTEDEVDIVTQVPPADAERVEDSEHARLVAIDATYAVAGVINREADGPPLADRRARRALNLAIDRDALVREAMSGRAAPLAGITPPVAAAEDHRLSPYPHDPELASELWREACREAEDAPGHPIRIAAPTELEHVTRAVATDIEAALGFDTEVDALPADEQLRARRRLAEKRLPQEWDLFIYSHGAQAIDAPPLELHRAFVGASGEVRAGPVVPEFEALYDELSKELDPAGQAEVSYRLDRFVHEEALALFLYAPQALYAVNRHVDFTAYRTTFELAECRMSREHWSRR